MLHFRNTYKNCKIMRLYMIMAILSLMIAVNSLLFAFIPEFKVLGIVLCIIFSILFIINLFLLVMKNNNYKLKNYFKLGLFNKEFKKFKSLCEGNKKRIKEIGNQQKDYFLQFGETWFSAQMLKPEKNTWNEWVEDASAFSYPNAKYMEKLSYLTYVLYNACAGGGGLEEFFNWISYEPFTNEEIIEIISKNEFFNSDLKEFLVKIIKEYDKEKQDELFERYELEDDKIFFTFENDIFDYANWLAYNRTLLSSCVGFYLHGNIEFSMYKLFLSKDYRKVVYIYSADDKLVRVNYQERDEYDASWNIMQESGKSIYDSAETAFNDIKYKLKDYIEIDI